MQLDLFAFDGGEPEPASARKRQFRPRRVRQPEQARPLADLEAIPRTTDDVAQPPPTIIRLAPIRQSEQSCLEADRPVSHEIEAVARAPANPAPVSTLADVLLLLEANKSKGRNQEMRSAVRTVARVCGRPASSVSIEPAALAEVLREAAPAQAGVGEVRWRNVRSLTHAALRECGVVVMPGRDRMGLSSSWRAAVELLPERRFRVGMSRMLSYFSRELLEPSNIAPSHFAAFHQALLTNSLHASPECAFRTSVRLWNEAAASVFGWPKLTVPLEPDPRRYSLSWESFPATFVADAEAFLVHTGNQDPLSDDYAQSTAPQTQIGRRRMIRQLASALVNSGFPAESLTDLSVLVDLINAKRALRYLLDRNNGGSTPGSANQAHLLRTVAKYWVKAPVDQVTALKQIASKLTAEKRGMVEKNRTRLRQFDAPNNLATLLGLPARVLREVQESPVDNRREATRVMYALAVEILTMAPLRRKNLVGLELGRHVLVVGRGAKKGWKIVIPASETKTITPFEMRLPAESVVLLETYLATYRSKLGGDASVFLFPGRGGRCRSIDGFGISLPKFILKETGITMNVHLFRHLAGKLYLDAHPHDIATVSRVLTHRSTDTTEKVYIEYRAEDGVRRYDDTISSLRGTLSDAAAH